MRTSLFQPCSDEFNEPIILEAQRLFLTSVSRSHAYQLERLGQFPMHIQLGANHIGWKLEEILEWIRSRPVVQFELQGDINDRT
ncbi:helix-turn-helix transcriptional regulator [Shewanella donghaensis]|uniref:helix-turn-helix transcriptional regulator n=1 Tax=Shewanella donghaensis TaxID=238836 RepID=UPI0011834B5A|nr:AlpA family phage regulatory protein [Shewanella donghaensis]